MDVDKIRPRAALDRDWTGVIVHKELETRLENSLSHRAIDRVLCC